MYLRILEDRRKFRFYRMSSEEKNKVVKLLMEVLSGRGEILVAVLFGGFVNYEVFRDVDIAVFTGFTVPYNQVEVYEEELSRSLEKLIGLPVDVRVIDYAPPWFKIKALRGIVLIEKEPALAVRLAFKAHQEIEDIRAKIRKLEK
ncbi:MAG: DNA polymerase subunit beta [Thermoprotei archaeon ex4572_64]|nr:MAG: DNA polymerase subunit beta [Thermoprotei archaeon ex4572_64]